MSLKSELLQKLKIIAENPENEFDIIISENKHILDTMSEEQLSDLYMLRRKGERLCRQIPYSREDISLLVESGEVRADGKTAELYDCFNTAKYILQKTNDKYF